MAWIALHDRPLSPEEVALGTRRGEPSATAPAAVYDFRRGLPDGPLQRPFVFDNDSGPPFLSLGARRPADLAFGFTAFAVLGALAAWSLARNRGIDTRAIASATLIACAVAVTAETVQVFVTGRTSSLVDLAAALAGAATGAVIASRLPLARRG